MPHSEHERPYRGTVPPHLCAMPPISFRQVLSYLWPHVAHRTEGRHGPLSVAWEAGTKVLNSANGNQSFGALHRVWQAVFHHLALETQPPRSVLLLGLGGGSVPAILRDELDIPAPITAVELDPAMIELARTHFSLDRHAQLEVIAGDAVVHVHALRRRFDLVLVDLFDDLDLARGVDTRGFAHGLRDRCAEGGTVCFNTVGYDADSDARCDQVRRHLGSTFLQVTEFRSEGVNRVFIAR